MRGLHFGSHQMVDSETQGECNRDFSMCMLGSAPMSAEEHILVYVLM